MPTCTLTLWSPVKVVFPTWQEKSISISIGISIGIFCFVSLWAGPLLTSSELTKKLWHSENFGIWSKVNKTQKYLFHENRTWETDCPADGGHHQAVVHPGLLEPGGVRVYSSSNLAVLLSYLTKVRCRGRLLLNACTIMIIVIVLIFASPWFNLARFQTSNPSRGSTKQWHQTC